MKTIYCFIMFISLSAILVSCEASSLESETSILEKSINDNEISNFELSAIDKDDAESIGTRD